MPPLSPLDRAVKRVFMYGVISGVVVLSIIHLILDLTTGC